MLSPWSVCSFFGIAQARKEQTVLSADLSYCNARNIDYPGFAWSNWRGGPRNVIPRLQGDFMWAAILQFTRTQNNKCLQAMFDEYDMKEPRQQRQQKLVRWHLPINTFLRSYVRKKIRLALRNIPFFITVEKGLCFNNDTALVF